MLSTLGVAFGCRSGFINPFKELPYHIIEYYIVGDVTSQYGSNSLRALGSVRMTRCITVPFTVGAIRQVTVNYTRKIKYRRTVSHTLNSNVRESRHPSYVLTSSESNLTSSLPGLPPREKYFAFSMLKSSSYKFGARRVQTSHKGPQ